MVEQTDQRTQASAGQVIRSSAGIEHFVQNQRTAFCRLGDAGNNRPKVGVNSASRSPMDFPRVTLSKNSRASFSLLTMPSLKLLTGSADASLAWGNLVRFKRLL